MAVSSKTDRERIARDTIRRTLGIITEFIGQGASRESTFYRDQLPTLDPLALDKRSTLEAHEIAVVDSDSFTAARNIISAAPDARGRTAVLNLASDQEPAGGWMRTFSRTQEEALCYSSTLYTTLKPAYYPWPNLGPGSIAGAFSPGVVIFKDDLDHGCADLRAEDRCVVSVLTVAAPRQPELTPDQMAFKNPSDLDDLQGKIRLIYRMAAHHQKDFLVLAAMGCGAYLCPPRLIAEEMKAILAEEEFSGRFRRIVFAIYGSSPSGGRNLGTFRQVFDGGD